MSSKPTRYPRSAHGFALVVTVMLMVLLSVLAVGMLSLASISLRGSRSGEALAVARSNARLALALALGDLQKHAGKDQAVTATAGLQGKSLPGRHWTGVWPTAGDAEDEPIWLVSGSLEADPAAVSDRDYRLVSSESEENEVRVPGIKVAALGKSGIGGRMAWWVSDEGVKARVDIDGPEDANLSATERKVRAGVPGQVNLGVIDSRFEPLESEDFDRSVLISMDTLSLAVGERRIPDRFRHDLTTAGEGLPVNVAEGGLKVDLSRVFSSGDRSFTQFSHYFGATPRPVSAGSAQTFEFTIRNPRSFYLVDEITRDGAIPTGPNWGELYNYHRIWENIPTRGSAAMPLIPAVPTAESDIRSNEWAPYTNAGSSRWQRDRQHVNSPVTPLVSLLQMGFRLRTEPAPEGRWLKYRVQIEFKPVVGLWNPYNIALRAEPYRFDWALYPYFRFGLSRPGSNGVYKAHRVWMREHWLSEGTNPEDPANSWFKLQTEAIDLQPGEFRLFSVAESSKIQDLNTLKAAWSESGAIVFDLVDVDGKPVLANPGDLVHVGDLFLEDGQHPETEARFGGFGEGTSASWFTLKAGEQVLNRFSDIWLPGTRSESREVIPEQVVTGWDGQTTTKPRLSVESLSMAHHHVATWAFHARTPAQAASGQELRGFVDCNSRALSANPAWDGSRVTPGGQTEGWYFLSPLLGGSHPRGARGDIGDGGPPGRGLIAEGGLGDQTPQTPGGPRFQGYGGAVNTGAGGQTHVIAFDVPRAPLVSIGQFQHAAIARYQFEPSFVVGNSYANPRIPLSATYRDDFGGLSGFRLPDTSYLVNQELWDAYFFSTLDGDYVGKRGSLDNLFEFANLASGARSLPNPRMRFRPLPGDQSIDRILRDAGERAPEAIAARLRIDGAFNVNSTSVAAWKSVLASLDDFEFPILNPETGAVSWENGSPIHFQRFGHVLLSDGYRTGADGSDLSFWQGHREIDPDELDELAKAIVDEVRARGPFRSMSSFVNRNPSAENLDQAKKGALQAALDRTLNADLPESVGSPTVGKVSTFLNDVTAGENQAVGHAAYLLQGDLLQTLAPILQPRSDAFLVRAMGEARDSTGKLLSTAVCEARIQREIAYLDPRDDPETRPDDLKSDVNKHFGRRFAITSFRWLSSQEL